MLGFIPRLLGRGAKALVMQASFEFDQQGVVGMVFAVADQQMQMRLGNARDQPRSFKRQAVRVIGFDDHEDAADGLHELDLPAA